MRGSIIFFCICLRVGMYKIGKGAGRSNPCVFARQQIDVRACLYARSQKLWWKHRF